jgi:hypothetical protein
VAPQQQQVVSAGSSLRLRYLFFTKSRSVVQLLKSKDRPLDSAAEQLERCGLDWKHRKEKLFKSIHRAHKVHHTNKVLCELFTKIGLYSDKDSTKIDWYSSI